MVSNVAKIVIYKVDLTLDWIVVQVIEASDVIVEVLDARDPLGCRCPQVEETVLKHEGKKKLMFILNKIGRVQSVLPNT